MGGHYLSALALMFASTGDTGVLERLTYVITKLNKCQQANQNGYLGGIPGPQDAWRALALAGRFSDQAILQPLEQHQD